MVARAAGLSESMEDYLEAILAILREKQAVRVKDIGRRLGVSSPSVTGALRSLSAKGLVNYVPYDVITLTEEGRAAAEDVARRHRVLQRFFTQVLKAGEVEAGEAACRMEHALSPGLMQRLTGFLRLVDTCPDGGDEWMCGVIRTLGEVDDPEGCRACVERCLAKYRKRPRQRKGPGGA